MQSRDISDDLMGDSASEIYFQSDTDITHISSSLFGIAGSLVGFTNKDSSDIESVRSPTSHLDLRCLSNFKNPFSFNSSRSSSDHECKKKWDCTAVGLGIVNSLCNETISTRKVSDLTNARTIIFRPQLKMINIPKPSRHYYSSHVLSGRSNSLPKNCPISSFSQSPTYNYPVRDPKIGGHVGMSLGHDLFGKISSCSSDSSRPTSSVTSFSQNADSTNKSFCSGCKVTSLKSSPLVFSGVSDVGNLTLKQQSTPISIDFGSLSAREIEHSEDYTCIISHGANPKTTHIFGDCILDCDANLLPIFGKKEEHGIQSTQVARSPERFTLHTSRELLTNCYWCSTVLKEEKDIYIYRDGKQFCSSKCHNGYLLAEEVEDTGETSAKSSECPPESSSHEDLFLLGIQFAE